LDSATVSDTTENDPKKRSDPGADSDSGLDSKRDPGYLDGQLLIAMPAMTDPRFSRSVIYLCAHSADGAVGLVINKPIESLSFIELLDQLDIETPPDSSSHPIHFGGPVESRRGFVLHSAEFVDEGTLVVDQNIALTATLDILRAIADGSGPQQILLALGYSGWGPGQLEMEFQDNAWLVAPADSQIIFDDRFDSKWKRALATLGIDQSALSGSAGSA
jgi:putative transcriptional regulator